MIINTTFKFKVGDREYSFVSNLIDVKSAKAQLLGDLRNVIKSIESSQE